MSVRTWSSLFFGIALVCPVVWADDALIESLIDQISEDNLRNHVEALEYPRANATDQSTAAAYIRAQLESYGYTVTTEPVLASENLYVEIPGSADDPQRFVLGAHFDTVPGSPGADDNGSGVAGLLEIARVLSTLAEPPEQTIELVAFGLEEVGKLGSLERAMATAGDGASLLGMISFDMIAYTCEVDGCQALFPVAPGCLAVNPDDATVGTPLIVSSNTASLSLRNRFLAARNRFVPALGTILIEVAGVGECEPGTRRSDHASYWDRGYPALALTDGAETRNPNYHQPTDVSSTMNFEFARRVVQTTLATILEDTLPAPPAPPEGPELELTFKLGRLTWTPAEGAVGYDVVRGDLTRLLTSRGRFALVIEECLANNIDDLILPESSTVAPGQSKFFLVRGVFPRGPGTWDVGTEVSSRDEELDLAPLGCP